MDPETMPGSEYGIIVPDPAKNEGSVKVASRLMYIC